MIPIEVKLKLKYGLRRDPSNEEIAAWSKVVRQLVSGGADPEDAGRKAAVAHFAGVDECLYGSESDNIAALLNALAAKR